MASRIISFGNVMSYLVTCLIQLQQQRKVVQILPNYWLLKTYANFFFFFIYFLLFERTDKFQLESEKFGFKN